MISDDETSNELISSIIPIFVTLFYYIQLLDTSLNYFISFRE